MASFHTLTLSLAHKLLVSVGDVIQALDDDAISYLLLRPQTVGCVRSLASGINST